MDDQDKEPDEKREVGTRAKQNPASRPHKKADSGPRCSSQNSNSKY
jgi:hypothetical protein